MRTIKIQWDGYYTLTDIGYDNDNYTYTTNNIKLNNDEDYGVYQVYGHHPIYGNDVLLYIGKADQQTFAKRLSQEGWEYNTDYKNIKFYIGRLFGLKRVTNEEWSKMIDIAERMLIFSHAPAVNASNIASITRNSNKLKEFENIRILNFDTYRSLMPEISGDLWIKEKISGKVFQME